MDTSSTPERPDTLTDVSTSEKKEKNAREKYDEMVKSDFPRAVQSLRMLWETSEDNDDLLACSVAIFGWFEKFLEEIQTPAAAAAAVASTDLIEILGDIIAGPGFLNRPADTISLILFMLTNVTFIAMRNKDRSLAKRIVSKGPAMWDNIWKNRELYERAVGQTQVNHRDVNGGMKALALTFREVCELCAPNAKDAKLLWSRTHLPHLIFTAWFYDESGNMPNTPMFAFGGSKEDNEAQRKDVLKAFGGERLVQRLHRDFEDPAVLNAKLLCVFGILLGFMIDDDFRKSVGSAQTFKAIITAMRRQYRDGEKKDEQICLGIVGGLLAGMGKEHPFEMCLGPMIAECDYIEILSRALVALVPKGDNDLHQACELIIPMGEFAYRCRFSRTDAEAPVFEALFSSLQRHWYPTLARLRALQPKNASEAVKSRSSRATYIWRELGLKVGLEETAEQVRYESGDDYGGTVHYFCSWRECQYRDKEPPSALMKCTGCGQAFYCNTKCQSSDWKAGGHRKMCKMLKAATSAERTAPSGVPAFGTLDVDDMD